MTDEKLSFDSAEDAEVFKVEKESAGQRLDVFLGEKTGESRSHIKYLIERQKVFVNNAVKKAGYALNENDELVVLEEEPDRKSVV